MVKFFFCNLIIAVGFNFCANLTVRSFLNCWDQFITIRSSQDFKYDHLNISPIYPDISPIYPRYIPIYPDISPIFYRKIKLTCACATDPIFPRYIGPKPIYQRYIGPKPIYRRYIAPKPIYRRYIAPKPIYRRYIADITDFLPIFPLNDYRLPILCRTSPISDISAIYRIFSSLVPIASMKAC